MKNHILLFVLLCRCIAAVGQTWQSTSTPTTTSDYNTKIQLTHIGWGSHHGILFNSHLKPTLNDGDLFAGNVLHSYDVGSYTSGAGAIMFLGNGGRMDFLISSTSSGANQPVDWGGGPKMTIVRNGNIGAGTTNPVFKFHIRGTNANSDGMALGTTTTGNFALTDAGGGAYGLFAGVSNTGRAWLQAGRHDSNVAYDLLLQTSGGNVGIGVTNPQFRLSVAGQVASGVAFLESHTEADNGYLRSNFGSNVYWDTSSKRWKVMNIGNNDFSAIIHPNGGGLAFITDTGTGAQAREFTHQQFMALEKMRITASGNVGIGTSAPDQKLTVKGKIHSEEVIVDLSVPGPDYVFEKNYNLLSLSEIEKYITQHKHLPEVPSAKEMEANGVKLMEMNILLLKKVEELTLHLIKQNQINQKQAELNTELKKEIETLKKNQ